MIQYTGIHTGIHGRTYNVYSLQYKAIQIIFTNRICAALIST